MTLFSSEQSANLNVLIRDPFFDGMIHEDDDDEDDDGGFHQDDLNGPHRESFDDAFRFGFSFGPGGMRFEEPQLFGQIFRDMEEVFASLGHFDERHGIGHRGPFVCSVLQWFNHLICLKDVFIFHDYSLS